MKKNVSNETSPTTTPKSASELLQDFLKENKIVLYRDPVKIGLKKALTMAQILSLPGVMDAEITLTPPEINARFEDGR